MKNWTLPATLAAGMALTASQAHAWEYIDDYNLINVSGALCRARDAASEWDVYHNPGSTSVGSWVSSPVRVFCPTNRRNLHAYDKSLTGSAENVQVNAVWIKVDSPSGNLQCRLFGRDRNTGNFIYSSWGAPDEPGLGHYIFIEGQSQWRAVNWGVMCDIPAGEAIHSIELSAMNQNG